MRRVAGIDYGRRRVGLALSDPLGITVRGLDTLRVEGGPEAAAATVWARLESEGVDLLVVGLPLLTSGDDSKMSLEARVFADALKQASGRPIELFDEGLTSWEAEEALKARGARIRDARRSGEVDRGAAVALLRSWLMEEASRPPREDPEPR